MLHLNIICFGKLKESYWREAESEYLKRLHAFAKVEVIELKEEAFGEKDPLETVIKKETEKIEVAIAKKPNDYLVVLDETGKSFSSRNFAEKISSLQNQGKSHITFVMGGPLGLTESIRQRADLVLSMSSFTFTHQMVRIFIAEQLYRVFMILNGKRYHY